MFELKHKPEKNLAKNILEMTFPTTADIRITRGGKGRCRVDKENQMLMVVRRSPDR